MEIELPKIDSEKLNKIKNEKLKIVLSDQEISDFIDANHLSIDFVRNNLYYFYTYLVSRNSCKNCRGLADCTRYDNRLQILLNIDKNRVFHTYRKCKFQKEIDQFKKKFIKRQFEDKIWNLKLKNCLEISALERFKIVNKFKEIINQKIYKDIFIHGDAETGKTFLLSVFAVSLAKKEFTDSISFIDFPNELKNLEYYFRNDLTFFNLFVEEMMNVQFLFIDDLGKEYKSEIGLENVLLPVLKYRKEHNLITFYSSRYSLEDLIKSYKLNKKMNTLADELYTLISKDLVDLSLRGLKVTSLK